MKKTFLISTMLIAALFVLSSCGDMTANNAVNRPANTAANNANAVAPVNTAAAEAEIRKLMDSTQMALAKNDAQAMEPVYADNYMLINTDGSVHNKAERLAALRSGDVKYTSFAYSDASIRVNPDGNTAIVVAKLSMKGTFKTRSLDGDHRVLHVWNKTKDGWKLVSAAGIPIAATAATTANSNTASANKAADSNKAPANR